MEATELKEQDVSPLVAEWTALKRIVERRISNPKQLKKYILKIQDQHPPYLKDRIFRWLLAHDKPLSELQSTYSLICEYMTIIPELYEQGYHGFLVYKGEIFPVKLDNDDETTYKLYDPDYKFNEEDETSLMSWMIDDWEAAEGKTFKGTVVMIWEYGFSGLGRRYG